MRDMRVISIRMPASRGKSTKVVASESLEPVMFDVVNLEEEYG